MAALAIARLTFLEARHRRLLHAVVLMGLAFLALFAIGFFYIHRDIVRSMRGPVTDRLEPFNVFLLLGLYVVNFLIVMLAVLTSVDTIAGEIDSGRIQTIVTKPLQRWEVVLGKWLGLSGLLVVFVLAMSTGLMVIVWGIARYWPPYPLAGMALMALEGLILLTLSILGGTRLSTLTNGVVVFMLYGLAFIAGWIEQMGALTRNEAAVNVGIVASLVMPSEAMWKRAAYLMQPPFLREVGVTPFAAASAPSNAMVAYAAIYIGIGLLAAVYSFQRRDL
jgi:Cu-processing system permease protein